MIYEKLSLFYLLHSPRGKVTGSITGKNKTLTGNPARGLSLFTGF